MILVVQGTGSGSADAVVAALRDLGLMPVGDAHHFGSAVFVDVDVDAAADAEAVSARIAAVLGVDHGKVRWHPGDAEEDSVPGQTRGTAGPGMICRSCGGVDGDHFQACEEAAG